MINRLKYNDFDEQEVGMPKEAAKQIRGYIAFWLGVQVVE
jgi:hypothetical protein